MGQQQLLLLVLGIIIVGLGIVVGIKVFREHAISTKRDLLIDETISIAANAIAYYKKPASYAGGGKKFTGWYLPESMQLTESGTYLAEVFDDSVIITGTGNEVVTGTDSVKIRVSVYQSSYAVQIIN